MRKFAWKRDPEDARDWKFKALLKTIALDELPNRVDLTSRMSPVEDQGDIGSCTANAVVGSMEYLEWKRTNARFMCFRRYRDLSRLFVYYNTRLIEGTVDADVGASIRNTVKSLAQYGVCDERTWAYEWDEWDEKPSDKAYKQAKKRLIKDYHRANLLPEILQALALGFPVAFGAMIFDSFMDVGRDGIVRVPKTGEITQGGHAMLIVGYNQEDRYCLVRNSWGTRWGDDGYCRFPFAYLQMPGACSDFWVIRR